MFPEKLRQLREERGMSQADLGLALNTTQQTVNHYEKGKRKPDQEGLERIADYFKVSVDWLLGRSPFRQIAFDATNIESVEPRKGYKNGEITPERMEEISRQISSIERTLAELKRSLSKNDEN